MESSVCEVNEISFVNPVYDVDQDDPSDGLHLDELSLSENPETKPQTPTLSFLTSDAVKYQRDSNGNAGEEKDKSSSVASAVSLSLHNGDHEVPYEKLDKDTTPTKRVFRQHSFKQNLLQALPHKVTFTRRTQVTPVCLGIVLVLVIILVAIGVGIYFVVENRDTIPSKSTGFPCEAVEGSLRILNKQYMPELSSPSSSVYKSFYVNMYSTLDSLLVNSAFFNSHNATYITGLRDGSIIVKFVYTFNTIYNSIWLESTMQETFLNKSHPHRDGFDFYLGKNQYLVEKSSLHFKGIVFGEEDDWIGHNFPPSSTPTSVTGACEAIWLPQCIDHFQVPYNQTANMSPLGYANQHAVANDFSRAQTLIDSDCHPYSRRFVCSLFVPSCVMESTGEKVEFPCRQLCEEFMARCMQYVTGEMRMFGCDELPTSSCIDAPPLEQPELRLTGGSLHGEGTVQIRQGSVWKSLCDRTWWEEEASVVCRQLNFTGKSVARVQAYFGIDSGPVWSKDFHCIGSEQHLGVCGVTPFYHTDCSGQDTVGVTCSADTIDVRAIRTELRLAGGASEWEGRLEVRYNQTWGTVCADEFHDVEAMVACKTLGYNSSTHLYEDSGSAGYTAATGPIWLDTGLSCEGWEPHLTLCVHGGWGRSNCQHTDDVILTCLPPGMSTVRSVPTSPSQAVEVRLVEGRDSMSGRLEVYYSGEWGTVCRLQFDDSLAQLFCAKLNMSGGEYEYQRFGMGSGRIWSVYCPSDAQMPDECQYELSQGQVCNHRDDVSISCQSPESADIEVRLVGGPNEKRGRLEVRHNDQWGTVCNDLFDNRDAQVFCRMLGFNGTSLEIGEEYGAGDADMPVWLDDVRCMGTETHINQCSHSNWQLNFCSHSEDISIVCDADREDATIQPSYQYSTVDPSQTVRLVGGDTEYAGRLEVLHEGQWGTVCDDLFDDRDARVFCRILGYDPSFGEDLGSRFGAGIESMPIWLNKMNCGGLEARIDDCNHEAWGGHFCGHHEDVSIRCTPIAAMVTDVTDVTWQTTLSDAVLPQEYSLRLVLGESASEGWLEVYHDNEWGSVCNEDFTYISAAVICRILGFNSSATVDYDRDVPPGRNSLMIWLSEVSCTGSETSLQECQHSNWDDHFCFGHQEDTYLNCQSEPEQVRLVGGSHPYEGRVEIYHEGQWGTICDDGFHVEDAMVICRSLGFNTSEVEHISNVFGYSGGPIWLESLECVGDEPRINACRRPRWGEHNCSNKENVAISCGDAPVASTTEQNTNAMTDSAQSSTTQNPDGTSCQAVHQPIICHLAPNWPYNSTHFPNYFGHMTVEEASIHSDYWLGLLSTPRPCHPYLMTFLCDLYIPPCSMYGKWPCKAVCKEIRDSCSQLLLSNWPRDLRCDHFNDDPQECLGPLTEGFPYPSEDLTTSNTTQETHFSTSPFMSTESSDVTVRTANVPAVTANVTESPGNATGIMAIVTGSPANITGSGANVTVTQIYSTVSWILGVSEKSNVTESRIMNVTESPISNVTVSPVTYVTESRITNVTESPITNVTESPITNVTESPVTNVTESRITNVTASPATNVTKSLVANITESPVTNDTESPVTNVTDSQVTNISESSATNVKETNSVTGMANTAQTVKNTTMSWTGSSTAWNDLDLLTVKTERTDVEVNTSSGSNHSNPTSPDLVFSRSSSTASSSLATASSPASSTTTSSSSTNTTSSPSTTSSSPRHTTSSSAAVAPGSPATCIPTMLTSCRSLLQGYFNLTRLPNALGHTSSDMVLRDWTRLSLLISASCHPHLTSFICSLLVPPCFDEGDDPITVRPCHSFCTSVESACRQTISASGIGWPWWANCNKFTNNPPCLSPDGQTVH